MFWLLLATLALADGIALQADPELGVVIAITVTDAADRPAVGRTVRVIHRPELDGEKELAIGITDARGKVRWTPEQAGVAVIRADKMERRISVRHPSPPASTVTLLILLGLAALASSVYGVLPSNAHRR